jgi:hypothetical protein
MQHHRWQLLSILGLTLAAGACASGSVPDATDVDAPVAPPVDARPADAAFVGMRFTFDTDLEGWRAASGARMYDRAVLDAATGHPGGCVLLDGSDLGNPDAEPNAWISRVIAVPREAKTLRFDTRAVNNGSLRVRLVEASSQSHTLLDYEVVSGPTWVARSTSLTPYAGKTVTLWFEQNDNDVGQGEHRYVDNIAIE